MAPRIRRLATAGVLQLAALVLAHQLVYLARYGSLYGEALVHSGHGDAWNAAVLTSLLLAAGLVGLGLARLHRLGALARSATPTSGGPRGQLPHRALLSAFLRLAPRVAVLQLVLLSTQENIEHAVAGQPIPGAGILFSPEYAGGAWIAIAVALVVSLVAALFAWRRDVLLARLRAARAALPRASASAPRRTGVVARQPVESILGRQSALRAPPALAGSA
jgi:hypothetical protein